ncbi:hypothetical protein SpCBS45565_g03388 [Spizellomyces sp. 'palustris']|nr:hypothetical protein SpCBS45565_g03388 [Spizellomyces sp. 'palustris']
MSTDPLPPVPPKDDIACPPYEPTASIRTPPYETVTSICCISLHRGDTLRLLNVPVNLHQPLRMVLQSSWSRGIQNEGAYGESYEYQLRGYPWFGQGDEAVPSRRLVVAIMAFMYHNGWTLGVVTDLSKKVSHKDSWYFGRATPSPQARFCSISFNKTDRLRLIEAPQDLVQAVLQCVHSVWRLGIQQQFGYDGSYEIKLRGNPWRTTGTEMVAAQSLAMNLISTLGKCGWVVYASVEISSTHGPNGNSHGDLDSWVLKTM